MKRKSIAVLALALAVLLAGISATFASSSPSKATTTGKHARPSAKKDLFGYHFRRDSGNINFCPPRSCVWRKVAEVKLYMKDMTNQTVDPTNIWRDAIVQAYTDWDDALGCVSIPGVSGTCRVFQFTVDTTTTCPDPWASTHDYICWSFLDLPGSAYYGNTVPWIDSGDNDHLDHYTGYINTGRIAADFGDAFGTSNPIDFVKLLARHEVGHTLGLAHDTGCGTMNPTLQFSDTCRLVFSSLELTDLATEYGHTP